MKEELTYLNKVMVNPSRPLAAVIGGAKVSGKLEVLKNLTRGSIKCSSAAEWLLRS